MILKKCKTITKSVRRKLPWLISQVHVYTYVLKLSCINLHVRPYLLKNRRKRSNPQQPFSKLLNSKEMNPIFKAFLMLYHQKPFQII